MPDNRFFERPIRGRRVCKLTTFSRRHLHSAKRQPQACHRKAGRSMEFRPRSRLRGDPLDTPRKVEEKSTRALDPNKLQRTDRWTGPVPCHPRQQLNLDLRTRSLQWRAAMLLIPSSPKWLRPGQAVLAQPAESPIEIPETLGEGDRNLIHHAGGDRKKFSANPPELSGVRRKYPSETLQPGRNNAVLPRRMGKMRLVRWHGECGDPTSQCSFSLGRVAEKFLIPRVVVMVGPGT